jgi:AraC-like DNA-binding protein
MTGIQFTILPPPPALKNSIECFRLSTCTTPGEIAVRVCPNTKPGVVFHQHNRQSAVKDIITSSGRVVRVPTLFAHGQVTELSAMYFIAPFSTVQVILKPHALRTVFGMDASGLTNSSIGPQVLGAEPLNDALLASNDQTEQVALLSDFLLAKQTQVGQRDVLVEQALAFIDQTIDTATVDTVHAHFGISERQLERRFKLTVGIAPRLYIRIRRINEAFRLMDSGQYERLSDIAYELNFHDQSHFIRDIKTFSGISPKSISQKVVDFHHDQVGSSYTYP